MKRGRKESLVFGIGIISTVLSVVLFFGLASAEAYIRWSLNQNFEFLGSFGLLALALLALGQVASLSFVYRPRHD